MEYTIKQLAELAGVTTRTLRWYDQIGLLRPRRIRENGYRVYTGAEVDRLQHILFYRALGVELAQIGRLLDDPAFDHVAALRSHLTALTAQRARLDDLIGAVQRALATEERKEIMYDREKFEVFKRHAVEWNEATFGAEIRKKYGDAQVDRVYTHVLSLTPDRYDEWKTLGDTIQARLEAAVRAGEQPAGPVGKEIAQLHRRWLGFSGDPYSPEKHRALAAMYPADTRFCAYYDRDTPGCAQFLCDAVQAWM